MSNMVFRFAARRGIYARPDEELSWDTSVSCGNFFFLTLDILIRRVV